MVTMKRQLLKGVGQWEDFEGSENSVCDAIMMDTCLIINVSTPTWQC